MKKDICSWSFSDNETILAMKELDNIFNYIMDPHGSVAYLAAKKFINKKIRDNLKIIILETAHAAKFIDVLDNGIKDRVSIPDRLQKCINKKKQSVLIDKDYNIFKEFLVEYIRKT